AYVVLNSNSSSVLVDALAQITSLLALLTLPLLLICAVLPTAFVDRRKLIGTNSRSGTAAHFRQATLAFLRTGIRIPGQRFCMVPPGSPLPG
ncbi:MAG: hypothetical protein ACK56E_05310, partial [Planctomyces sp.]